MTDEQKRQVLKTHLGRFYVVTTQRERELYTSSMGGRRGDMYLWASPSVLLKFGCVWIMTRGKINFRTIYSYDLVETFLGNKDDYGTSFYNVPDPYLIIYHMKVTMPNKRLETFICQTIATRMMQGKVTLVLTEVQLQEVELAFPDILVKIGDSQNSAVGEL